MYIARYSIIRQSELDQRMMNLTQHIFVEDANPMSLD